jgi:HSP20 family molecular chaperone IbpA
MHAVNDGSSTVYYQTKKGADPMALMRYTPQSTFASWAELDMFSDRLSRVFGNSWDSPEPTGSWIPAVNVEESADELLLTAELPGMNEEDINLNL